MTGANAESFKLDLMLSEVNAPAIIFEGMPRMIFGDENNKIRSGKGNWVQMVNNLLSFKYAEQDNLNKRQTIKKDTQKLTLMEKDKIELKK